MTRREKLYEVRCEEEKRREEAEEGLEEELLRRKPGLLIGGEDCGVPVVGESRNYREVRTSSLSRQGNYEQSGLVCNGAISFRITRL